jgi:hypothetical protein
MSNFSHVKVFTKYDKLVHLATKNLDIIANIHKSCFCVSLPVSNHFGFILSASGGKEETQLLLPRTRTVRGLLQNHHQGHDPYSGYYGEELNQRFGRFYFFLQFGDQIGPSYIDESARSKRKNRCGVVLYLGTQKQRDNRTCYGRGGRQKVKSQSLFP